MAYFRHFAGSLILSILDGIVRLLRSFVGVLQSFWWFLIVVYAFVKWLPHRVSAISEEWNVIIFFSLSVHVIVEIYEYRCDQRFPSFHTLSIGHRNSPNGDAYFFLLIFILYSLSSMFWLFRILCCVHLVASNFTSIWKSIQRYGPWFHCYSFQLSTKSKLFITNLYTISISVFFRRRTKRTFQSKKNIQLWIMNVERRENKC